MVKKPERPNISFRVDADFLDEINSKSEELGITRSELVQNIVFNVLNYQPDGDRTFRTLTIGKLKSIIEHLPDELPVIAFNPEEDNQDYAVNNLRLKGVYCELVLDPLGDTVMNKDWSVEELYQKKRD